MTTPRRVVLLGPPGSGKGTQGVALAKHLGIPFVSSGEALRANVAAGTDLGRTVADVVKRGDLVSDDLVLAAVRDALAEAVKEGGYVLDGFPRTVAQARRLDAIAQPDAVVYLAVPDEVARERLTLRADEGRIDDADRGAIERRLHHFHDENEALLDLYRDQGLLTTVDAAQLPAAVKAAILTALARGANADDLREST